MLIYIASTTIVVVLYVSVSVRLALIALGNSPLSSQKSHVEDGTTDRSEDLCLMDLSYS